ncbi:MAG: hypothetical protein Q8Q36_00790 [bacterium]|nr:hypothetical protein [bacterium]
MLKTLMRWVLRFSASRRIPAEAYGLIEAIHRRYFELGGEGAWNLDESRRLDFLIRLINQDREIKKLNSMSFIGSIFVFSQTRGPFSKGFGKNLCIDEDGLFLYEWDDFDESNVTIRVDTSAALERHGIRLSSDRLRQAVAKYAEKKSYIERVVDFGFRPPLKLAT